MTLLFAIKASTTDAELERSIPFLDMRREAIERRDDAAAVIDTQGDQTVLEYHELGDTFVLFSPTFGYAYVNTRSAGTGDSLQIDNGGANSPEQAAALSAADATIEKVYDDPVASDWVKQTLRSAVARDACDALYDAELLVSLLKARFMALTQKPAMPIPRGWDKV